MKLVLDLEQKALDANISITDLLRSALTVAMKLDVRDYEEWIKHELYGYVNVDKKLIPEYRFISGVAKYFNPYRGWCDVFWATQEQYNMLSHIPVIEKISEVEELSLTGNMISRDFPVKIQRQIAKSNLGMVPQIIFNKHSFVGILDAVKNNILSWALDLEKQGILGENMVFNEDERHAAESITINNYIGHIENSNFQQGKTNNMNISYDDSKQKAILTLLEEIKGMLAEVKDDNSREEIIADIATIEQQMKSPKPKMELVHELLSSIRNVMEGACGSLIASYPTIENAFHMILG